MIRFTNERWDRIKKNSNLWWEGRLGRPLIQLRLSGADPGKKKPVLFGNKPQHAFYNMDVSPEKIVDYWDYEIRSFEYLGDSFPNIWLNFGPGILAAFLGAEAEPRIPTVWFHPPEVKNPEELSFKFNPENIWFKRIIDICDSAIERWEGVVQMGMTDLGGVLDVLSTFRPGENLLLDLYDRPDEIKRLVKEIHSAWWEYYDEINKHLQPANPGHTCWTPIFSEKPYYMLQCDFAYMIGPGMFDEFVKPELEASCEKLENAFYHLDGPGQLAHLDSLLGIEKLTGIQWVPGDGQPDVTKWPEVYRKINKGSKLIQIWGRPWGENHNLDRIAGQISNPESIVFIIDMHVSRREEAMNLLEKYEAI